MIEFKFKKLIVDSKLDMLLLSTPLLLLLLLLLVNVKSCFNDNKSLSFLNFLKKIFI